MDSNLWLIQFLHPRKEPDDRSFKGQHLPWHLIPEGNHKRKFLLSIGAYLADGRSENGEIVFWGEWEPESSVIRRIGDPKPFFPHYVLDPFYVLPKSYNGLHHNTDPFVFGDQFFYSNCLQHAFPKLRHLSQGSVILFGSCQGGEAFVLDTVFVVDHWMCYTRANYQQDLAGEIPTEFEEVTMLPLQAELAAAPQSKSHVPPTLRRGCVCILVPLMSNLCTECIPLSLSTLRSDTMGFARPRITMPKKNCRQEEHRHYAKRPRRKPGRNERALGESCKTGQGQWIVFGRLRRNAQAPSPPGIERGHPARRLSASFPI